MLKDHVPPVFLKDDDATSHPDSTVESLWTIADVARYLRVSTSWVYHQNSAGNLPRLKGCGALVRFAPNDVRRWADDRLDVATRTGKR